MDNLIGKLTTIQYLPQEYKKLFEKSHSDLPNPKIGDSVSVDSLHFGFGEFSDSYCVTIIHSGRKVWMPRSCFAIIPKNNHPLTSIFQ